MISQKKISHIVISHCGQEAGAYEVKKKLNKILPDCQIHIERREGLQVFMQELAVLFWHMHKSINEVVDGISC